MVASTNKIENKDRRERTIFNVYRARGLEAVSVGMVSQGELHGPDSNDDEKTFSMTLVDVFAMRLRDESVVQTWETRQVKGDCLKARQDSKLPRYCTELSSSAGELQTFQGNTLPIKFTTKPLRSFKYISQWPR